MALLNPQMNNSDLDVGLPNNCDEEDDLISNPVQKSNPQIVNQELAQITMINDNPTYNVEGTGDPSWNASTTVTEERLVTISPVFVQTREGTDSDVCSTNIEIINNQDIEPLSIPNSVNNHSTDSAQIGKLTLVDTNGSSLTQCTIGGISTNNINNNNMIIENNRALNFHIGKLKTNSNCSLDLDAEKAYQSSTTDDSVSDLGVSSDSLSSFNKGSSDVFEVPTSYDFHEMEKYKEEILHLKQEIVRLKEDQARLNVEASHTTCRSQLDQQRREIELFKQEHELDRRTQATMKLEFDSLKKQYESANKEKEASVMRYATSEMEVIKQRNERENVEKKYKEVLKEKEGLTTKLKNTMIEKARINLLLDNKCSELFNAQKDIEKLKEELNSRDIKIKWTQNKLRTEMESHKESEAQVEKLSSLIQDSKDEVEKAKKEAENAIKQFQSSQENRAFVLEQQLRELQAQLILERHNLEDKENSVKQLTHEVDALFNKQQLYIDENNALKLKASSLEKEKQENETTIMRLRENVDKTSQEVGELQEKTCTMESLILQLKQEKDKVAQLQTEISELKTSSEDLLSDMASCREREAEMLEFTQKVTAKNVRLQSEFSCVEAKARQLEFAEEPLQRQIDELTKKIESLQKELTKERADRGEEKRVVARHLAEKTARVEVLMKEVEDLKGENQVMKHKQATSLRELNREVHQYRRKLEQLENNVGSNSLCQGSRASSCNSLNDSSPTSTAVTFSGTTPLEPDKQTMVDRILRLQRDNVRLREKIDFLEEHAKQLVSELQKKTRVLQSYILREEAGTLSSSGMDFNKLNLGWAKLKTKAELTKHGGIMASVYGSKPLDDTMTLELSLEINRKLQAVLEDTLLKNITLKENIDTLGDEIRRLSRN